MDDMKARKRTPLTAAQRETIAELRGERGWTMDDIAQHLKVSYGAVAWRCLIDCIEKPGAPMKQVAWTGKMVAKRGAFEVRRFSAEEDAQLLQLEAEGHSRSEIGRRIGRRPNSITGRLATLARRDERAEAGNE